MSSYVLPFCLLALVGCAPKPEPVATVAAPPPVVRIAPTVWEFVSVSKKITDDDPFGLKSGVLNTAINEKLQGHEFVISQDSFIVKDSAGNVFQRAKILKKTADSYTIQDADGKTGAVKYQLSADKAYLTFIYEDGSTMVLRKSAEQRQH